MKEESTRTVMEGERAVIETSVTPKAGEKVDKHRLCFGRISTIPRITLAIWIPRPKCAGELEEMMIGWFDLSVEAGKILATW